MPAANILKVVSPSPPLALLIIPSSSTFKMDSNHLVIDDVKWRKYRN